jgi:hypothetical protein
MLNRQQELVKKSWCSELWWMIHSCYVEIMISEFNWNWWKLDKHDN